MVFEAWRFQYGVWVALKGSSSVELLDDEKIEKMFTQVTHFARRHIGTAVARSKYEMKAYDEAMFSNFDDTPSTHTSMLEGHVASDAELAREILAASTPTYEILDTPCARTHFTPLSTHTQR